MKVNTVYHTAVSAAAPTPAPPVSAGRPHHTVLILNLTSTPPKRYRRSWRRAPCTGIGTVPVTSAGTGAGTGTGTGTGVYNSRCRSLRSLALSTRGVRPEPCFQLHRGGHSSTGGRSSTGGHRATQIGFLGKSTPYARLPTCSYGAPTALEHCAAGVCPVVSGVKWDLQPIPTTQYLLLDVCCKG